MKSSPVLDTNSNLYLSVNQDNVSVGSDGKKRWDLWSPCLIDASPVVAANGEIYFSAPWRDLMAVTPDGRQVWRVNTDNDPEHDNIIVSPVIGRDGTIYVANVEFLCAINSTNHLAPLAKSSWPMFRANPRHTGRLQSGN
jgi:outer membrane protein assembly factor BamB